MFQTLLPNVGPGALKNREDPNERAGKVRSTLKCTWEYIEMSLAPFRQDYVGDE